MEIERDDFAGGDDSRLLQSALGDEAPVEEQASEAPVEETKPEAPPRDEHGRFAPKAQEESAEQAPVEAAPPQTQEQQQRDPGVPRFRVKEEADKRRSAEERADRLEQMLMQMLQAQRAPQQPPQQPQEPPDIFTDPDAWYRYKANQELSPVLQQIQAARLEDARAVASVIHGEETVKAAEQAFNELAQRGGIDPAEYQRIQTSANPFRAAVEWHQRQAVLREVGSDPKAYRQRVIEDALKDPEVIAKVIETYRNGGAAPAAKPNNLTRLPPSLTRASGSSAQGDADQFDDSDRGLLRSALSGR
ncbi:hypothetical protein C4587_00715 [Candidatus Parcubacteria bacterium]|nr:MAG: hypothetical protein C4587_00715 [Candidatus Parcubacteria bacterium]